MEAFAIRRVRQHSIARTVVEKCKSLLNRAFSRPPPRKMLPIYRHRCQVEVTFASLAPAIHGRNPPVAPVAQSRVHSTIFPNMTPSGLSEYPSAPVAGVTPVGLIELQ